MSLDDLRDQILSNFNEERVKVNQRLLIDKILARYSSEFVIYRELMQNSDDAKSSSIQIVFETENNKVKRIIFKNNGFAFRPEDWDRLKTIAEGNPDEQKIGAFGVGFYSLFSFCENPFVSSGGQGMAFYWRENQLFTKQGPIEDKDKGWTTFLMDARVPIELPDVEDFARFLANSSLFTVNLQEISVYFNDTMPIKLSKKMQDPKLMVIASEYDVFSPLKLFHLTSVDVRDVQLDVKYQTEESSIFFRIASGNLDVSVNDEFSEEMERITKKKPPNKTNIQMIFTGFEKHNSSSKNVSPVFKDLLIYPEQGRLYIGFSTQQTTGCCSHLAARVIPTMERESIDLANKTLAEYNSEMLCLAGTLCRILYEDEMDQIKRLYNEKINNETNEENIKLIRELLEKRAAHALTHFTFSQSTPNKQVGEIIALQFFNCLETDLSILSTNGVLPISDVRIPNSEMIGFIKKVPLVPKIILEQCDSFLKEAKDIWKFIVELTFQDVLYELKNRTLSEDEMIDLLKWWISYKSNKDNIDPATEFMKLARIGDRPLNTFRYILNPGRIPPNIDIPDEVLPYTISKNLESQDLKKWLGWTELTLVDWAKFIVNKPDLENEPTFARKVLQILARNLDNTSKSNIEIIRQLFVQKKCIPTILGMKIPNEAYFENVNLFPDLPRIDFEKPLTVKNLMELFGVRKVVELELIFDHLNGQGDWDHMKLIKYLATMYDDLKDEEIKILKNKPIWPKEDLLESNSNGSNSNEGEETKSKQRFIARKLYTPIALHREFGLPVISFKGRWSHNTDEGKFLIKLGLKDHPTLEKILELVTPSTDSQIHSIALKYLLDNFDEKYSKDYKPAEVKVAFLPCMEPNIYSKPLECFINSGCEIMKFQVVQQDLRYQVEKLGVLRDPNREMLLNRLTQDPPQDKDNAKKIFEYLASQQTCFTASDWKMLANSKFIPVKNGIDSPNHCFFKIQDKMLDEFYSHVDFGDKANGFLSKCGVKAEPSYIDYVELLTNSSVKLWKLIGNDIEKYLSILRNIASSIIYIRNNPKDIISAMKKAPVLVGITKEKENIDSEIKETKRYHLVSAENVFICDDESYRDILNPITAPVETILEDFYKKLGCRLLSESVKEISIAKGNIRETKKSRQLLELIIERASIFYFGQSETMIKRNEEYLKKLKAKEIDYIETTYTLDTIKKVQQNEASILQDKVINSWVLFITSNSNFCDISKQIIKFIFKSKDWNNWKEITSLNTLLTSSLENLKFMGIPVDRILKQKNNYQHVVNQMRIDQGDEFSFTLDTEEMKEMKSPSPVPSDNKNYISGDARTINYENMRVLRSSLHDAVKACYSRDIDKDEVKEYRKPNIEDIMGSLPGIIQSCLNDTNKNDYCEIVPDEELHCVETLQDIDIYIPRDLNKSEILSQAHTASLDRFINMLRDLVDAFEISLKDISIFYDNNTNTIAFNRNRIMFFNFRFYLGLHDEDCKIKPTIKVITYWFMMFCHELAHNFIKNHNSEHEYYSLSFVEIYMPNFLELMKKRQFLTSGINDGRFVKLN
ncbi:hypothetical protein RhiirA1_461418 [Rhizophagus irregularis]|uniref:Sacsin/Nov domain-containing protein n=2 Tax=Rhizophagus irregularis TaxID=588596 RepID=A0A2I1EBH3_9GLOM|nr:hypothetical protein RhiirA1_461418 [Rhizophagus irregularis]PKY19452.1 hypothetical protein RhiirB3_432508 [Rhizophagus irregularis]CAB4491180.1 unnamed protein product [Rhizophagus irregularis]CAB5094085.1 unnamed protein product [Rhizophagus irregularis]CAB5390283.1 unnamed protein product [Rhizophagus irregularis]